MSTNQHRLVSPTPGFDAGGSSRKVTSPDRGPKSWYLEGARDSPWPGKRGCLPVAIDRAI